ncbi:MAG: hypothetical protein MJ252_17230, partial [archaeon]|nr:hypothetical protein [archaeon]
MKALKQIEIKINNFDPLIESLQSMEISAYLNDNTELQTINYPFKIPFIFKICEQLSENIITLSFYENSANSDKKKLHSYQLKMNNKFFQKIKKKIVKIPLSFNSSNDPNKEEIVSTNCEIIITSLNSSDKSVEKKKPNFIKITPKSKEKLIKTKTPDRLRFSQTVKGKSTLNLKPSQSYRPNKEYKPCNTQQNFYPISTIDTNSVKSKDKNKEYDTSYKSLKSAPIIQKESIEVTFSDNNTISKKDESEERISSPIKTIPTEEELLTKSINNNSEEQSKNFENIMKVSNCLRCPYFEKLIIAQQNDIKALQSQIDLLIKGESKEEISPVKLKSEEILKEDNSKTICADFNSPFKSETDLNTLNIITSPSKSTRVNINNISDISKDKVIKENIVKVRETKKVLMKLEQNEQEKDSLLLKIAALEQKNKALEYSVDENKTLKDQIKQLYETKKDFEEKYKSILNENKKQIEDLTITADTKLNENLTLQEEVLNLNGKKSEMQSEINLLRIKLREKETEMQRQKSSKEFNEGLLFSKNTSLPEQKRIAKNEELQRTIDDVKLKLDNYKKENTKINDENLRLLQKVNQLENALNTKTKELNEKSQKLAEIEISYSLLNAENYNIKDLYKQKEDLRMNFNKMKETNTLMRNNLNQITKSYRDELDLLKEKNIVLEKEIANIRFNSVQYPIVINEKAKQIEE